MRRLLFVVLGLLMALPAFGQVFTGTQLGTAGVSSQIVGANPLRKRLMVFNPNAAANLWICDPNYVTTCTAGVAGSILIIARGSFVMDGNAPGSGQGLQMPHAFNAVSDTNGATVTVGELN